MLLFRKWVFPALLLATVADANPAVADDLLPEELCPKVFVLNRGGISLTDNEKILICGDPETRPWREIPPSQALYHWKTFLQDRGHYFATSKFENGHWVYDTGTETRITKLALRGIPEEIAHVRFGSIKGEVLTPKILEEIERRVSRVLQSAGYGCSKIKTMASAETGEVELAVEDGGIQKFVSLKQEPVHGLWDDALRRYDAFHIGQRYDVRLPELTAQRTLAKGVLQSTHFTSACTPEGMVITQKVTAGPPRLVSVGFGFNTDLGLVLRPSWKDARLGNEASIFNVAAKTWYRTGDFYGQELTLGGEWFFLGRPSRLYLQPAISIKHESQEKFRNLVGKLIIAPAITTDTNSLGMKFSLGPSLHAEKRFHGAGREKTFFLSVIGEAAITTHEFEYYRTTPRDGFEFLFSTELTERGIASDVSARMFRATLTHLWNVASFEPPKLIVGFRVGLATTLSRAEEGGRANLPPSMRHFLGGSTSLRGFGYQELPDDYGGLSAFFSSLELRLPSLLPWGIQPFLFGDVGSISPDSLSLNAPWFGSPGLGIRWQSPIGALRTSLARGYVFGNPTGSRDKLSHWQFHFTLGEEF